MKYLKYVWIVSLLTLQVSLAAEAEKTETMSQESSHAASAQKKELAKKLANPISSMISVPLQLDYERGFFNTSDQESTMVSLTFQPVVPFSISEDWNVISRTIVPIIRTDDLPPGSGINGGVGDIIQSFFFSPKAPTEEGWIWGVGPAFLIPSGSDLSAETWGVGPTAVGLKQDGPLTYGLLTNHIWSTGGKEDISTTFIQPFFGYTTHGGMTPTLMSESTYDWKSDEWTIPLVFEVTQVGKIGDQFISYGAGVKYYAKSPDSGPQGWSARFIFTWMFPK